MKKFYFKTLASSLCLVLCISLLSGCGDSEISLVKDAPVPMDSSITFGQLFDSYKYCKDGTWEVKETDRGQKFVEFRGKYDILAMMYEDGRLWGRLDDSYDNYQEAADYCEDSGLSLDLIAQFMINTDGKSFYLGYLDYEFEGKSQETTGISMERGLSNIVNNDYFKGNIPSAAHVTFIYLWHKFILTTNEDILLDLVTADTNDNLYFLEIEDVTFNDTNQSMILNATLNITDVKINQLKPQDDFNYSNYNNLNYLLSCITSIDIKKHIVHSEKIALAINPKKGYFDTRIGDIMFNKDNAKRGEVGTNYGINIQGLFPLKIRRYFR